MSRDKDNDFRVTVGRRKASSQGRVRVKRPQSFLDSLTPRRNGRSGGYRNRPSRTVQRHFHRRVVVVVEIWTDFLSGDGNLSPPGCAGSMYDLQSISDRPAGLGFPHHAGRFRPGGSPFLSPGCRSCRRMEGFLNRGWGILLPGCGEIVGFRQGATPAALFSPPHWARAGGRGALAQR